MKRHAIALLMTFCAMCGFAQGLEDVIVETYYISDANDATDTDGGSLLEGSVTYRVFIDMAPGYNFQAVYGDPNHQLLISTSNEFFNNEDRGEDNGNKIRDNRIDDNTVALDSWVSVGGATDSHLGILKTEDSDGSIIGGSNNDGGSEGISGGLLVNNDANAGIPLTTADGITAGTPVSVTVVGLDLGIFGDVNDGPSLSSNNGSWAALGGATGPTAENRILIGQFTTTGEFSFELNIQLGTPAGGTEKYVAKNAQAGETLFSKLNFNSNATPGCTSSSACNFDASATIDDGSCLEPTANCSVCNGATLDLIDDDGDGICNAEEIFGCTSNTACNFDSDATEDNGSCLEPVANCTECNGVILVIIDTDIDGVCDADEIAGCTSNSACNFDPSATDEDGSCIEPDAGCTQCQGGVLVPVDSDGDGVCDADEIDGCTSNSACNFDASATDDDGSCLEPVANCSQCNGESLEAIDTDGDGVCDADEIEGCTSNSACNYDASATEENGSCLEPVANCSQCNGAVLEAIDSDGDGVCDADEVNGCTSNSACNFDSDATEDDGSCIEPVANCSQCNGAVLEAIDSDGDGVCDADEIDGCTSNSACNFDASATDDDGSCIEPVANCSQCNGAILEIIDADGDGVCDADEIEGCTSNTACNFEANATDDDGSCLEPVSNCSQCDGAILQTIDTDGDGVCDADEIPGCTSNTACNFDASATDDNGTCQEPVTNCSECQGSTLVAIDTDGDGVCDADEVDGCTSITACNFDGNATDDDGSCIEPVANCSQCNGSVLEAIDSDGDGVCDADEITGCTSSTACNYDATATDEDGSCIEPVANCSQCNGSVLEAIDSDGDGVCDADEIAGCTSNTACNFDVNATDDNGTCLEPVANCSECQGSTLTIIDADGDGVCNADEIEGCTSRTACNFDGNATDDNGSCVEPTQFCTECQGGVLILIDSDGDGTCDADEEGGCTSITACNYDPAATEDNNTCLEPEAGCTQCNGAELVLIDADDDGVCDADEVLGCTSNSACNFDNTATDDDGSCLEPVVSCSECNGAVLVSIDSDGDGICDADEIEGCTSNTACNFDANATDDNGSCLEPVANCSECNGTSLVTIDSDGDGVCDADEIEGCTSNTACNFNANATDDNGSCLEPVANCSECNGALLVAIDSDGDGVCDADEIEGCTSNSACNFNPNATDDNGSCLEPIANCSECQGAALVTIDADGDGVCDADEIAGCTSSSACNFNSNATDDNGTCLEPVSNCSECDGTSLVSIDSDGDGVCDADEIEGCTSNTACNFNANATDDNGSCLEPVANCSECDGSSLVAIDSDGDGVCNADEIDGCTSNTACNFNSNATDDDGSCLEPVRNCSECNGAVLVTIDSDGDGVCDADEIEGCTSNSACNFNPNATDDNGSCLEPVANCSECDGSSLVAIDSDSDGVCDADEIEGCTSNTACNYNPNATDENGSCVEPVANCSECNGAELRSIDTDNDGICDADEIEGCTSSTACNYTPNATDDNGTCLEPVSNCSECDGAALIIIDSDGDGVCDADEIEGCTSPTACNFDETATNDNGTCIEPVANCSECRSGGLVTIDSDGDGICDADEIAGCTSATACNFNPNATDNDDTCLEPEANCSECDGQTLVTIDTDGDGVCDAEERAGCRNSLACNFNPDATDEDRSCILPVPNCQACNANNDGLVIIDSDGDGICDAEDDPAEGLEGIVVEVYYIADADDATDSDGGQLDSGAVTYRVFADLLPEYVFQAAYGEPNHPLIISTTTSFFNNADRGEENGDLIGDNRIDENTVALDSWVSVGGATDAHLGIPKELDLDGSIIGGSNNDGGSEGIDGGLLKNDTSSIGIPLTTSDGLAEGTPEGVTVVGVDLSLFGDENSTESLETTNGSWASLNGSVGATEDNLVLIGQFTTTGEFAFELNLQVRGPKGEVQQFVAKNPQGDEIEKSFLTFVNPVLGCTDPKAINFLPFATEDDGSCDFITSLSSLNKEGIQISPNPAYDNVTIDFSSAQNNELSRLVLRDVTGKVLSTSTPKEVQETIDLSSLPSGVYVLEYYSNGRTLMERILKL